jgi:5-methylcytosine-specific restriction endonuclease McrA
VSWLTFLFGSRRRSTVAWCVTTLEPPSDSGALSDDYIAWVKSPAFYQSRAWQHIRYTALKAARGRCQCCGRSSASATLHVDHIRPRSRVPHLALVSANLQVLCDDCNMGKGTWDETDWRAPFAPLRELP